MPVLPCGYACLGRIGPRRAGAGTDTTARVRRSARARGNGGCMSTEARRAPIPPRPGPPHRVPSRPARPRRRDPRTPAPRPTRAGSGTGRPAAAAPRGCPASAAPTPRPRPPPRLRRRHRRAAPPGPAGPGLGRQRLPAPPSAPCLGTLPGHTALGRASGEWRIVASREAPGTPRPTARCPARPTAPRRPAGTGAPAETAAETTFRLRPIPAAPSPESGNRHLGTAGPTGTHAPPGHRAGLIEHPSPTSPRPAPGFSRPAPAVGLRQGAGFCCVCLRSRAPVPGAGSCRYASAAGRPTRPKAP